MKKNATLKLLRKKSPVFLYKKPLVIKLSILSSFSSFGIALVESTLMLKTIFFNQCHHVSIFKVLK